MHTNQLGLYHIANAEGLLMLATNMEKRWGCSLEDALAHLYNDFKFWCQQKKITCSQRRWSVKKLNLMDSSGPQFPTLVTKAYNARIILAFLADACMSDVYGFVVCS